MKKVTILLSIALVCIPLSARSDQFVPVNSGVTIMQPIPVALCGGPWCSIAYQYIQTFNGYANAINQVNRMGRELQTYPQQATTNFTSDMRAIANIVSQAQGVNYQVGNIEQQVSQIWPNYTPGTPLTALNQTLNNRTASAIIALLKGAGVISQQATDESSTSAIHAIRSAAASAVNPTQAAQVEVQMLTLIWEQMVKEQRLLALRSSEEAQHDLAEASTNQQQQQFDQSLIKTQASALDASPPQFTDAQIQAITAPATRRVSTP